MRESTEIPILYRDARLIAVDKPGGLLVHRTAQASDKTAVLQQLRDQVGCRVYPVHRLDRAASGITLFALDAEAAAAAQRALAAPETEKVYLVLVRGSTPECFESRRPLHSEVGRPQEAWTEFRKLAELARCSLLEARLHTGRRHQIRRHLAHLAHQVIGDTRYGKGRINRSLRETHGLPRLFLHAHRLRLRHPLCHAGEDLVIESPLAPDLDGFLRRLAPIESEPALDERSNPLRIRILR